LEEYVGKITLHKNSAVAAPAYKGIKSHLPQICDENSPLSAPKM